MKAEVGRVVWFGSTSLRVCSRNSYLSKQCPTEHTALPTLSNRLLSSSTSLSLIGIFLHAIQDKVELSTFLAKWSTERMSRPEKKGQKIEENKRNRKHFHPPFKPLITT